MIIKSYEPKIPKHFRHNVANCFYFNRNIKVGILGGSFDPAHDGHLHISNVALKRLKLNEIWWLVSPQNRLKTKNITSTFYNRLSIARNVANKNKQIRVLDLEHRYKIFSSWQTVNFLKEKTKITKFFWIMGSDNLLNFNKWLKPKQISKTFPVAVIERPSYSYRALNCLGAKILGKRLKKINLKLPTGKNRSWVFLKDKLNQTSSTRIRNSN